MGRDQSCGKPLVNSHIMGGQKAAIGKWPWQVNLRKPGYYPFCGGTLISETWVLTEAYCVLDKTEDSFQVVLGDYDLDKTDKGEKSVAVKQIIIHPSYDGNIILPVCLPEATVTFPDGQSCWVTGWGDIKNGTTLPYPQILRQVELKLISNEKCNDLRRIPYKDGSTMANNVTDNMMCAGYAKGLKDACKFNSSIFCFHGDGGGPLVCPKDGRWYLAGLESGNYFCGLPNRPGLYTRLTSYVDWITETAPEAADNVLNVKF
ncbi:hypothetical protein XELAEV_18001602mg [Xenopus laevis]|nr:hypothetical protein XELAEV_18001602mg [Xenopus laevis]